MQCRSTLILGLGLTGALCAAAFLSGQGFDSPATAKPEHPPARESWSFWNEKGRAQAHRGDSQGAIESFDRAITLNPSSAMLRMNRGSALLYLGDLGRALEEFDRAVALDPSYPELRLNRAQAKSGLGDWKGAVQDFETALTLAPSTWPFRKFASQKLDEAKRQSLVRIY